MKIDLENSKKWTDKERKKIKKRAITIGVLTGIIIISTVALFLTAYIRKTKGLFYPNVTLEDTVTGAEPTIIPTEGYTQVLKAPSLPYTMLVKGEMVSDSDSFCVFLSEGMYITVAEVPTNATSDTYISTAIIPTLNGTVEESKSFKKQTGFLNERSIESQGITITLSNKAKLYTMNMRVFLGEEKDILISVISASMNMSEAEKIVEAVFYSLHFIEEGNNNNTENMPAYDEYGNLIDWETGGRTDSGHGSIDESLDDIEETVSDQWQIHNSQEYIDGEEYEFEYTPTSDDDEWLGFAYAAGSQIKLKSIIAIGPDGTIYQAEELRSYQSYFVYGFHIGKNQSGTWKFIFSSDNYIGEYFPMSGTDSSWKGLILKTPMFE